MESRISHPAPSFNRAASRSALHVIIAAPAEVWMVVGQAAAADEESEIIADRTLLGLLDLRA